MKTSITPNITVTIDIHSRINIPIVVRDSLLNILDLCCVNAVAKDYVVRTSLIQKLKKLYEKYNFDTILIESNKLFIDKIDRHPDPIVLRNICRGFGIQISIDDTFHNDIANIIALPNYEWHKAVLGSAVRYSFDLYKAHIKEHQFSVEELDIFDKYNYYQVLCLSECVQYDHLMNKKYLING